VKSSVTTTTVHLKCHGGKPLEALRDKMISLRHRSHDAGEGDELILLAAQ
jgi:hypothetical protein